MAVHWGGRGFGHTSRWTAAASGGTPTPPFAFPEDEMLLGMGLAGISGYSGYYPFANVAWNAGQWARESGSGAWSQEWGELTAAVSTDVFVSKIAEGDAIPNLPDGVYTVLNPDGCEIGIGWGGTPNLTGWQTATEFTFTKSGGSIVGLWAKGSVTNINGPIQIIMPGRRDAFLAGDYWNPAFITFLSGLGVNCLRFMDWFNTYSDLAEDWADRVPSQPILLRSPTTRLKAQVSYDLAIALANQLDINPWINIPVRATDDYVTQLATKLRDELDASRYVYIEYGNETWNFAAAFNDARVWVEHLFNTRYEAMPNSGINGWTRAAHGLVTGDFVANFFDRDNFVTSDAWTVYPMGYGSILYVERVDDDNFKLYRWTGTIGSPVVGTVVDVGSNVRLLYKKHVEAGKTVDVNTNHGIRSKQVWDIFNAVLGAGRCVNVMGTQLVGASGTTARLAPAGVRDACDAVAVASYYSGDWWVTCLDIASGQVTPKTWSRNSGGTVRVAVYAAGSTPTMAEVLAGTGAGYIGHRDLSGWAADAASYTSGAAITGLTNGTSYECRAVLTGQGGYKWMAEGQFTASATASTVPIYDSDENMAMRARRDTVEFLLPYIASQAAAAGDIPVIGYEVGSDYFGGNTGLTEVKAYRTAFTQTEIAGESFGHFYTAHGASGLKLMNQFVDINGTPGVFNMAENFDDTDDYRYQKFVEFGGSIPNGSPLVISDLAAPDVTTEPSYPAAVYTFADPALTYSIFNGDLNGNFAIVGDELRISNGTGINWTLPTARTLTIEASNGLTTVYFDVTFATGFAWYEADAEFAWSALVDTDAANIDPEIGNQLPVVTGTAASISGGLLTFDGTKRYGSLTGLTATLPTNVPFLVAIVLDKNADSTSSLRHASVGSNSVVFANGFSGDSGRLRFDLLAGGSAPNCYTTSGSTPSGKQVHWAFYNGSNSARFGMNQTENGAAAATVTLTGTIGRQVYVGGDTNASNYSKAKIGAKEVVSRAGMTYSDALAIVQKMQTLHGI